MTIKGYLKVSVALTLAGSCFAGYLSGIKLFRHTCAFGESCPTFLGQPACYYGFAIFLALFIGTLVAVVRREAKRWPIKYNLAFSALGIIFAGSFVVQEVADWVSYGFRATFFGLSTCAYGLIFFILIFGFSLCALKRPKVPAPSAGVAPPTGA